MASDSIPVASSPVRQGAVRLRYSVVYHSERARLLQYLSPRAPPTFHIPFRDRTSLEDACFVQVGSLPCSPSHSISFLPKPSDPF